MVFADDECAVETVSLEAIANSIDVDIIFLECVECHAEVDLLLVLSDCAGKDEIFVGAVVAVVLGPQVDRCGGSRGDVRGFDEAVVVAGEGAEVALVSALEVTVLVVADRNSEV